MSVPISVNNFLLHKSLFSDVPNIGETASEKIQTFVRKCCWWSHSLTNCTLQAHNFVKVSVAYYSSNLNSSSKKLLLFAKPWQVFSKCLLVIFLKAIAMHNKNDCEKVTYQQTQTMTATNKQALNAKNTFPLTISCFPWQASTVNLQPTYLHFFNKDRGNTKSPPDWWQSAA